MQRVKLKLRERILLVSILIILILISAISKIRCPFKHFLGIPCAGCGMTRAIKAVLRLDYKQAFHYHPLFWLTPIMLLVALFGHKLSRKRK